MKLFLNVWIPQGQRHYVMDPVTLKKQRPGYILFPDKCIKDIPEKDANHFLENVHTISDKPMKAPENAEDIDLPPTDFRTRKEAVQMLKKPEPKNLVDDVLFSVDENVIEKLMKLADKDFSKLSRNEVTDYGKSLGISIPVNIKKNERLAMLDDRCKELTDELESKGIKVTKNGSDYGENEKE